MIMSFEAGQKVMCVNDHYKSYSRYPVNKGTIYTIHGHYRCPCGSRQVTLEEFPGETLMGCRCPRTNNRRSSYYDWRFIPLDLFDSIVELSSEKIETIKRYELNR